MRSFESYKNYYADATKEQILEDTYIEFVEMNELENQLQSIKTYCEERMSFCKDDIWEHRKHNNEQMINTLVRDYEIYQDILNKLGKEHE